MMAEIQPDLGEPDQQTESFLLSTSNGHDELPANATGTTENVNADTGAPVKKSWASLVKSSNGENLAGPLGSTGKPNMMAFVVTTDEKKQRQEMKTFQRLGEIIFSRSLIDRKLDHRTLYLTPRGLLNRGNTCYMNAVLQALVFCPPFFHLLEALDVSLRSPDQPSELPPIVSCFVNLARSFRKMENTGASRASLRSEDLPLDPSFVCEALEEHATEAHRQMLSRGTQEDAQESLNHILLLLHEEMVKATASLGENLSNRTNGSAFAAAGHPANEWTSISKGQKKSTLRNCDDFRESPMSHIFGGKLRSVRKFHGARDAENVEPFFMLDLPIQDARVTSVFQAIERFMGMETIHGFQDRGVEVNASRKYRFEDLPAVLILHLKYFEYTNTGGLAKLQKNVTFESSLRLPERWFADRHFDETKSFFRLSAVIFHWGQGTEGGHYTASIFHPASPSGWIEANDAAISVVGFDYIRQPQHHRVPYLLFYRLAQ